MPETRVAKAMEAPQQSGESAESPARPVSPDERSLAQIIASQLEALRSFHQQVLETSDVEAIHKLRVTTRRLQASLDLVWTDHGAPGVGKLKKQLRKWRHRLSEVRNYDVFLLLLDSEHTPKRVHIQHTHELLKERLKKRRARRAEEVRVELKKIDVGRLAHKLGITLRPVEVTSPLQEEFASHLNPANDCEDQTAAATSDQYLASALGSGPALRDTTGLELPDSEDRATGLTDGGSAHPDAGEVAAEPDAAAPATIRPELLDEPAIAKRAAARLEQRLAEFQQLAAQSHPTTDPAELHKLRIAAKRLRYLIEIVSEMGFDHSVQTLAYLKSLQDRIGEWHDLESLENEIIVIVSRRKFMKQNLPESAGVLRTAAQLQKRKQSLVSKLFPVRVPRTVPATSRRLIQHLRRTYPAPRGKTRAAAQ